MSRLSDALPRRTDLRLVAVVLLLALIGIAMVISTTSGTGRASLGTRQAVFVGVGALGAVVLVAIDYRLLLRYSAALWGFGLLLLVGVLLFGTRIAGSKAWFRLGEGLQLQPSEFVRIPTVLLVAWILENDDRPFLQTRTILTLAAAVGIPVGLILLQPDLGVALTYIPIFLTALFFGGLKARYWGALFLAAGLFAGSSWFFLKDYQKDRIRTFLDPDLAARGAGYQVRQARIAIGSGGILGKGWKEGTQSRLGFLPVRHTDFIFAALAEERGFVGVSVVMALFGLLVARGMAIARDARDRGARCSPSWSSSASRSRLPSTSP